MEISQITVLRIYVHVYIHVLILYNVTDILHTLFVYIMYFIF